jgi:hypothetical protein
MHKDSAAKRHGVTISEMMRITGRARQTLHDMKKSYPLCFDTLALGCSIKKQEKDNDSATNDSKKRRASKGN